MNNRLPSECTTPEMIYHVVVGLLAALGVAFLMSLSGCNCNDGIKQTIVDNYFLITIDSCEYIVCVDGNSMVMTHKGNCKNPIHIYNKQNGQ